MDQLLALIVGPSRANPLLIFNPGDLFNMGDHQFRVIELVGVGGAGAVYKCCSPSFAFDVCVKVAKATNPVNCEIQFMLMLHRPPDVVIHPNLLPLLAHSTYTIEGQPTPFDLLCTPYVNGGAVGHARSREPAKFTEGVVQTILYDVASALAELHDKGILHGDVSPWNILLEKWTTSPRGDDVMLTVKAVLCDFGISRRLERNGTTAIRGYHPVFKAPEVVDGIVAPAADIYSLGATMVHVLYGVNEQFYEHAASIRSTPLRDILQKCLRLDPNERYANAQSLWTEGLETFRWATVEEQLSRTLKDRFMEILYAKKEFWKSVGAALVGEFTLVINGTGTAPRFRATDSPQQG